MGILELMGALLTILGTLLPTILTAWNDQRKKREETTDALARRSLDELHAVDRVQSPSDGPVQP